MGQRKTGKTWAPWRGPAIRHTQRMAKKKGPDGAVGVSQKNWPKNIDGLEVYHPVPPSFSMEPHLPFPDKPIRSLTDL